MTPTASTRFLQHLPQLITLFFSITLVNGFRLLADQFHWSTGPTFNLFSLPQFLLAVSFGVTMFWIVTAWLGYSLLIERHPYTLNFARFFLDIIRFSLMFALLNFAFLAGTPGSYHIFLLTLTLFHMIVLGWYRAELRGASEPRQQREWRSGARNHAARVLTYGALGLVYYAGVAARPGAALAETLHVGIVALTCGALVVWNVRRLAELKALALREAAPASTAAHSAQQPPQPAASRDLAALDQR